MGAACSPGPLSKPTVAAPLSNPIPIGSEEARSGALESARGRLKGTWELAALELAPSADAARVPVQAAGTLTYDEFGNLTMDVHTTDPRAPVAAREVDRLSFKGRVVLDVDKSEMMLMNLTGNANPDEVLAPERRRRYEFNGEQLTLSSFDNRGRVLSVSTWRRLQQ
jgi:hypothetical protein